MSEVSEQTNPQVANDAGEAERDRVVPRLPDPPHKWRQDTEAVDGDEAMNLPEETEMEQRPTVQG
jgi:hypothetical protein